MAKRRFTKANINFLSLCPRGVNRLPVIYKSEDKSLNLDTIIKASEGFDDNGELTAVVYAPEFRDSEGDIASAAVIKEAMYESARNGLSIDMRHNEKALPKTAAFIAESFIVQKGDARFTDMKDYNDKPVDVTGAWAVVIKIEDKGLRKAYKDKEWNGISMGGTAAVEMEKADLSDNVLEKLAKLLNTPTGKEDNDMTDKELKDALAANNEALAASVATAVAKAMKPTEAAPVVKEEAKPVVLTAPIFKGSMSDIKAVKAHQLELKKFNLAKAVDFNDDKSVETYMAELAKLDEATGEKTIEKSAKEVELEKELAEERKRSNQPAPTEISGEKKVVTKEADMFAMGKAMAGHMNERRGYATKK